MSRNIILRPVFNRPEMLRVSIDYEIEARKTARIRENEYLSIFLIEYGTPKKSIAVAKSYPYPAEFRFRKRNHDTSDNAINAIFNRKKHFRYGLSRNILEGMKEGFGQADSHVIVIEDDIVVHSTYFLYLKKMLDILEEGTYSAILSQNSGMLDMTNYEKTEGHPDCNAVHMHHDYSPWATLLSKRFYLNYIEQYASENYYNNRHQVVQALDERYRNLAGQGYKYSGGIHAEQAGLINRLTDIAMLEKGMFVATPEISRSLHIGFYGANRGNRGRIPGYSFRKRCQRLRTAIENGQLNRFNRSKRYRNYPTFHEALNVWDGMLTVRSSATTERKKQL